MSIKNLLNAFSIDRPIQHHLISQVQENDAVKSRNWCKKAKASVFRRRFISARNTTKTGGKTIAVS
jgi:hypothetical protein